MKNEFKDNVTEKSNINKFKPIFNKDASNKRDIDQKTKEKEQPENYLDKLVLENRMLQKKQNKKYGYLNNNIYLTNPPDFRELASEFPRFAKYVYENKYGGFSIKWNNKNALKELNRCLLKKDFEIDYWDIPDGFLIPTITSRLNYICWVKSLLDDFIYKEKSEKASDDSDIQRKKLNYQLKFLNNVIKGMGEKNGSIFDSILNEQYEEKIVIVGLDIGTGANCIYPLLGYGMYKWHFKASDINPDSIESAHYIVAKNNLESFIRVEKQNNENCIFYSVVKPQEILYFCMCNPPYFDYSEEKSDNPHTVDEYNSQEVYCEGGESKFIKNMIDESVIYKNNFLVFTTLVGRKINFLKILEYIKTIEGVKVIETTEFLQGKLIRWGLAWSFFYDIDDFFRNNPLINNNFNSNLDNFHINNNGKEPKILRIRNNK